MNSGNDLVSIRVKTELLAVGSQLKHAMQDELGRVVLKAGAPVTAEVKEELLNRGLQWVMLHPTDAADGAP